MNGSVELTLFKKMGDCEEFNKLWFTPVPTEPVPFINDEESFSKVSYVFKSFRSEFEVDYCFSPQSIKAYQAFRNTGLEKKLLSKSNRSSSFHFIPGYSPLSFVPKKSVLTKEEMSDCYSIYVAMSEHKAVSEEQLERLRSFEERITTEQSDYLSLAKSEWNRENYKRHREIIPEIENFVNSLWREELSRVRAYPKFYAQSSLIPLAPEGTDPIELTLVKHLVHFGKAPKLYQMNLKQFKVNINLSLGKVRGYLEGKKVIRDRFNRERGYCHEVSRDKVAEECAVQNRANVVMSASSLLCLVDNHGPEFSSSWELPVTIKEYTNENGSKYKIVYVDKPFCPTSLSQYDRKKWYSKIAADIVFRYKSGLNRNQKQNSDEDCDNNVDMVGSSFLNENTNCDDEASRLSGLPSTSKDERPQALRYECRVTYKLWKLQKITESYLSKNVSRDLLVVIRSKEGHCKKEGCMVKVVAKSEYQQEFGAETATLSEIIRDWASLLIRPDSKLTRVRLSPVDGELIMTEELSLNDLNHEAQRLYRKNLNRSLVPLQSVLVKLSELPTGSYHLSHKPSNSAFAPLFKATEGTYEMSLRQFYVCEWTDVAPEYGNWNSIDTSIITPTFHFFKRVPAMYMPSSKMFQKNKNTSCMRKNIQNNKQGKKKGKGKKRRNKNNARHQERMKV